MTAFGLDTSAIDEEPAEGDLIGDQLALIQACCRRLITPRGGLWYDENYGTDLRQFLSESVPLGLIESVTIAELLKEEAVQRVTVRATPIADRLELRIQIFGSDATLEFTFALDSSTAVAKVVGQ